jgi:hypothetical protein
MNSSQQNQSHEIPFSANVCCYSKVADVVAIETVGLNPDVEISGDYGISNRGYLTSVIM